MSFQNIKSDSYCVGGKHRSPTVKIYGDITTKGSKILIGYCSVCNREKSMTVSDNIIKAEGLGDFFRNLGKVSSKAAKKLATNALKIQLNSLKLEQTLLPQQQVEILKQIYQHYQKLLISITLVKAYTYHDSRDFFYINGTKM